MKNIMKYLLYLLTVILSFASCKKEENQVYLEGFKNPVLTVTPTGSTVLTMADSARAFLKMAWTNPDYRFTTGISSQDVMYLLQIDTVGAKFSSPDKIEVAVARDLSINYTVKEFNTVIAKLKENVPHNIEMRIKATVNGAAPLYSNVFTMMVTPYLDVTVPIPTNGTLWATGDAFPSGYANPLAAPYVTSQQFTKVSNTLYELTVPMPGGGAYKLIQINGDWSTQYHMITGGAWSSGKFEMRDADPGFPGPPGSGTYKITVNFKTGEYSVVKL